jgi:cyclophilin family peptidyl-prolyl cis-trans isomerase
MHVSHQAPGHQPAEVLILIKFRIRGSIAPENSRSSSGLAAIQRAIRPDRPTPVPSAFEVKNMLLVRRKFIAFVTTAASLAALAVAAPTAIAADAPQVKLNTTMGTIVLELYQDKAPKSVANFLEYVRSGHYDGTVFHRVINNFMIQGGGFDKNAQQKPTRGPIQNEAGNGLRNDTYTVAMARTSSPHSATAQFFINVKNNNFLNYPGQDGWGYTVFGRVLQGTDVVDKIKAVKTGPGDVPVTPVIIESASIIK